MSGYVNDMLRAEKYDDWWTILVLSFGPTAVIGVIVCCKLMFPIVFPTIICHPWPKVDEKSGRTSRDKQQTVVFAGSFNPPHNGHLAMTRYLAERYGKVILVVGMNPDKQYIVSPQERRDLLKYMLSDRHDSNIQVEVVSGLIWRTVKPMGASIFVRGIRSWSRDGQDETALQVLNTWGPLVLGPLWWPLPTTFIEGQPHYNHVSSTLIRDLCQQQQNRSAVTTRSTQDLSTLVPRHAVDEMVRLYGRRGIE